MSDGPAIEDLVQETLIAVHTHRMSFDQKRAFKAWLFAVARYKMIDQFRRARKLYPIDALEDILASDGFEDSANARMDVDQLLAALPHKQSLLIRKTRIEGHSVAEAARETGFEESDVKVSIHRGLKALAARIMGGADECGRPTPPECRRHLRGQPRVPACVAHRCGGPVA